MSTGPFITEDEIKKRNPAFAHGTPFDNEFNDRIKQFPATMGLAMVDLSDGLPKYGINNQEHVEKHIYSLAKIGALLAAFRLRERLRNEFVPSSSESVDELVARIEKAWKPQVKTKSASLGADDFPNLLKIFDIWTARDLDSAGAAGGAKGVSNFQFDGLTSDSWDALQGLEKEKKKKDASGAIARGVIDNLPFASRLKLAIRMSDNNAAGSVINDLGLSYIYGTLVSEGLYSPQNHGLWISNTYGYNTKFARFEAKGDDITAGGTAYAVALFFTLLYQRKFFALDQDNQDMLDIMKELSVSGIGTHSLYSRGNSGIDAIDVSYSKIGLDVFDKGHDFRASEGAIIERVRKNSDGVMKHIRYVAVALQAPHADVVPQVGMVFNEYMNYVSDGYLK